MAEAKSQALIDVEAAVALSIDQRKVAVARYLVTVACVGRMMDELCQLHADLEDDDRLHQVLNSLGFVWQNVEAELVAAAGQASN